MSRNVGNTLPGPLHIFDPILDAAGRERNKNYKYNQNNKKVKLYHTPGGDITEDAIKAWYPDNAKEFLDTHKSIEEEKSGLVPPPFKYLGPGNSLNRGPAYNQIDADAEIHDLEYQKGEFQEEIAESDRRFLQKAGDHIIEGISGKGSISDTIGSIAGGIGIGIKHIAEKVSGKTYYPSNLTGKHASSLERSSI